MPELVASWEGGANYGVFCSELRFWGKSSGRAEDALTVSVLRRWRQDGQKLKASLGFVASQRSTWDIQDPVSRKKYARD